MPICQAAEELENFAQDLNQAIQNHRNAEALKIIQAHPELLQPPERGSDGFNWIPEYCFIAALRYRNPELAADLLKVGAPINGRGILGATALHHAAGNDPNLAVWLLDNGADINCAANDGIRPLHIALASGESTFVTILLKHGADPTATANGRTCLYFAAASSHPERMLALLKPYTLPAESATDAYTSALRAYFDRNLYSYWYTPQVNRKRRIRLETLDDLVDRGAGYLAVDQQAQTLLHFIVQQGIPVDLMEPLLDRCLKAGVPLNAADRDEHTALDLAVRHGDYEWVLLLCRRGASLGARGVEFNRTLKILLEQDPAYGDHASYRRTILALGPTFAKKPPTVQEWQNLHQQLTQLHQTAFIALLEKTTDVDAADTWGRRLLQIAAGMDDSRYLQIILARHPDLNLAPAGNMTALHSAAFLAQDRNVKLLLDAGADPWLPNSMDQMPIETLLHAFRIQLSDTQPFWLPATVADLTAVPANPEDLAPSHPIDPGLRIRHFAILQQLYRHQFTGGNRLLLLLLLITVLTATYAIRRKQAQHRRRPLSATEDERMNTIMARTDWRSLAPAFERRRQWEFERRRLRLATLVSLLGAGVITSKFATDPVLQLYVADDRFRIWAITCGSAYATWQIGVWLPWRPVRTIVAVLGGLATLGACGWGMLSAADIARYPHFYSLTIVLVCGWAVVGLAAHAACRLLMIEFKVRRETANLANLPAPLPHSDDVESQPAWDQAKPPAP